MQTAARISHPAAFKAADFKSARRSSVVVRAQRPEDYVQNIGKKAAVAAAALALTLAPPSMAATPTPKLSALQKEQIYQQELLEAIKARTGKADALPSLTASPTDTVKAEAKIAPLKFDSGVEKVKVEAPTPAPAVPATVAPPKATAYTPAPAPTSKPAAFSATPSAAAPASSGDNKGLIAVGGIAVVAIAAFAASNNNGAEGGAVTAPAAASAGGSSDVLPNVAEARAWIAAWKKKHNKA